MNVKFNVGNWVIDACEDDDGHLTVVINHEDESKVNIMDVDIASNETEWVNRFITERMERDYLLSLDQPDQPNQPDQPENDEHMAIRGYN